MACDLSSTWLSSGYWAAGYCDSQCCQPLQLAVYKHWDTLSLWASSTHIRWLQSWCRLPCHTHLVTAALDQSQWGLPACVRPPPLHQTGPACLCQTATTTAPDQACLPVSDRHHHYQTRPACLCQTATTTTRPGLPACVRPPPPLPDQACLPVSDHRCLSEAVQPPRAQWCTERRCSAVRWPTRSMWSTSSTRCRREASVLAGTTRTAPPARRCLRATTGTWLVPPPPLLCHAFEP